MKKTLSLILALLMLLTVCPLAGVAAGAHEHSGVLQSLRTEAGLSTKYCGVFYCAACGKTYEAPVTYKDVGMPIINIDGSLDGISKGTKVMVKATYSSEELSFSSYATLKIQGFTSIQYPKKNYTIQFVQESGAKNKVLIQKDWGRQSKYCLKANWTDFSQARNIVSARLFGEVVHSRGINDDVDALYNGGAIDGYPVLLYQNGDFLGLYTFNMPKDNWIFNMDEDNGHQGILGADYYTNQTSLWETMPDPTDVVASGFDLEYCSTEETEEGVAWLGQAFNDFISYLLANDGAALKTTINDHTTVERCIDYFLFVYFIRADDNHAKNILWLTYDGVKFIPSAYDMDGTWGVQWNGKFLDEETWVYAPEKRNRLYERLIDNYSEEIKARYVELRQDILSLSNIERQFSSFIDQIPTLVYTAEKTRWPSEPGLEQNNYAQIIDFAKKHIAFLDSYYGVTIEEKGDSAYRATFAVNNGATVSVYPAQDLAAAPQRAEAAYSVNEAGELTKDNGSVTFKVNAKAGNVQLGIAPEDGCESVDSLGDNNFRINGVSKDIKVTVHVAEDTSGAEGYNVNFVCPDGVRVLVYPSQDFNLAPTETTATISVDSDTGVPTKDGGQVNFTVVSDNKSDVFTVSVSPDKYKNIKGFDETGIPGTFRITKIKGDLTVTIAKDANHKHDYSNRYAMVNGDKNAHRAYCACGQYVMAPHHFSTQMLTDYNVFTQHEYKVCDDCGFGIKLDPCTHICHSTNPILQFVWKIQLFFYRLFRVNQICVCGRDHY